MVGPTLASPACGRSARKRTPSGRPGPPIATGTCARPRGRRAAPRGGAQGQRPSGRQRHQAAAHRVEGVRRQRPRPPVGLAQRRARLLIPLHLRGRTGRARKLHRPELAQSPRCGDRTRAEPGRAGGQASLGRRCAWWERPCGAHHVLGVAVVGGHEPAPAHRRHLIQQLLRRRRRLRHSAGRAAARLRAARRRAGSRAAPSRMHRRPCTPRRSPPGRPCAPPCLRAGRGNPRRGVPRATRGARRGAAPDSERAPALGKFRRTWPPSYLPERSACLPRSVISRHFIAGFSLNGMSWSDGTCSRGPPLGARPGPQGGDAGTGVAAARLMPRLQRVEWLAMITVPEERHVPCAAAAE